MHLFYSSNASTFYSFSSFAGLKKHEPSTYPRQWPLLSVSLFPDPSELWKPLCESSKLGAALDALLGAGKWECPQEKCVPGLYVSSSSSFLLANLLL